MRIPKPLQNIAGLAIKNSPTVLTYVGVASFFGTVITAIDATRKSTLIVNSIVEDYEGEIPPKKEVLKRVAPLYIPTVLLGILTVSCMIGSNKVSNRRNALLTSAYSMSELALKEYKDKVIERIGEKEEQKVRDDIARDRIAANPVQNNQVLFTGKGKTLCYESLSGRYFESDIEKIRRVENDINQHIICNMWVTLNELYSELGLPAIDLGEDQGWTSDHRLKFYFTSQLTEDERPCLVIGYEQPPRWDYRAGM